MIERGREKAREGERGLPHKLIAGGEEVGEVGALPSVPSSPPEPVQ
jgi:hypothetical protein